MRRIWLLCALLMALTAASALASTLSHSSRPMRPMGPVSNAAHARKHHHPARGAYLFGDSSVEPNAGSNRAGVAESVPVTSANSGTARSLRVYLAARNHAQRVVVGLYSNRKGRPGKLLASGSLRLHGHGKWVTVGLVARSRGFRARAVHAGITYWIAVLGTHGRLSFRDSAGGACRSATSRQRSLSAMPRSWRLGGTRSICRISAYVSGKLVPRHGGNTPVASPPTAPAPPPAASGLPPIHCDLHATTSTLSSEVAAASTGQTVCLATGNYGSWSGTNKAITIAPEPNASPTMAFDFRSGAANFTINGGHYNFASNSPGIDLTASTFDAGSQNITLEGVAATDNGVSFLIDVRSDGPGIVIRDNVFHDMLYPNTTSGAIRVLTPDSVPASNIVIENNMFRDMGADGIDPYSAATMVGNDFLNVASGSNDPRHTDSIQFFGGPNKIIEGNFVDGCSQGIDAFDGSNGNTLEDNVIIGCTVHSLSTYADTPGSLVAHNTVIGRGGEECGAKSGSPASTTLIRDNVLQQGINWGGVLCTPALDARNMSWPGFGQIHSAADFTGKPVFVGGANPTTYAGYALAAGSPGKGQASDGGDVGARVSLYPRPAGLP
jgi:hypothetical protein